MIRDAVLQRAQEQALWGRQPWAAAQIAYDSKIVDPVQPPYVDQYINGYQAGINNRRELERVIYEQGRSEGRRDAVAWMIFGLFVAGLLWTLVRYLLIAG